MRRPVWWLVLGLSLALRTGTVWAQEGGAGRSVITPSSPLDERALSELAGLLEVTTPQTALRLSFLRLSLSALADLDDDRWWYGGIATGAGAVLGGTLYWVKEPGLRGVLGTTAALLVARGAVRMAMPTHAGPSLRSFVALPARDPAEVATKLAFGEKALGHAGRVARKMRLIEGALMVIASAGQVPLSWGLARADDASYKFGDRGLDYVGLTLSIIGVATGLVQAFRKSDVELLERDYRALPR